MALRTFIQSLGARHVLDFDPVTGADLTTEGTQIIGSAGGTFLSIDAEVDFRHVLVFCTFTTPASFPATNEEVIWENGGSTTGAGLYLQTSGALGVYFGAGQATPKLTTSPLLASTQYSVIVEFHSERSVQVHYQTGNSFDFWSYDRAPENEAVDITTDYSGTDDGGYGAVGGVPGGNTSATIDAFTGTLDSPLYYCHPLDDYGNSTDPTFEEPDGLATTEYSFVPVPVCEGLSQSVQSTNNTSYNIRGFVISNRNDINFGNGNGNGSTSNEWNNGTYGCMMWAIQSAIQNPTVIYEQGGGTNNLAFTGGALTTWQAADAGQPFLILQSKSLTQAGRPYFYFGKWEHHTQHAGSGNRIILYVNGVEQGEATDAITANFPGHSGNIAVANSSDSLKSFAETTLASQTVQKNVGLWATFVNNTLSQAQIREIFERTVFADVTIAADTVANQQAALDLLIGNTYENTNCAIRVLQATDATDYRLFVDNITFNADPNLEDISIQFVGTGVLTLEDTNGTVIKYTSSPAEVEQTTGILVGGGSIAVVNDTIRYKSNDTITNSTATKLVFDGTGTTYTVSGGSIGEFENVSGSTVTVTVTDGATIPTITETNGAIVILSPTTLTLVGLQSNSEVRIYQAGSTTEIAGVENSGTLFTDTFDVDAVDIVIFNVNYKPVRLLAVDTSSDLTLPIQQIFDRNYANP
jgi:hypothetical protein